MNCQFQPTDEPDDNGRRKYRCIRCGRNTAPTASERDRIFATCRVIGLGDYVTYWLALFGLTKERVEWFTGKPCGCAQRQKSLNTFGERWRHWWNSRLWTADP